MTQHYCGLTDDNTLIDDKTVDKFRQLNKLHFLILNNMILHNIFVQFVWADGEKAKLEGKHSGLSLLDYVANINILVTL